MNALRKFVSSFPTVPAATAWYLADLGEARRTRRGERAITLKEGNDVMDSKPLNSGPLDHLLLMKKTLPCFLIGLILCTGAFWGCSDRKEPAPEKGAIRQMTDEAAKEAVNQIRTPIDKARSAAQQQEEKNKEMEDTLKKQ